MSEITRFLLPADLRVRIAAILPGVTDADFEWLGRIIDADGLLRQDGTPHPAFVGWVRRILDRDAGDAVAVPVVPKPVTGPAGAMVAA